MEVLLLALLALTTAPANAQLSARQVAARSLPAVVTVVGLSDGRETAFGSGFLADSSGLVVTNAHVLEGALGARVLLGTRSIENVLLAAIDTAADVAVLDLRIPVPLSLAMGDDSGSQVGERVYAVGSPLGLEGTFSDGIISAHRNIGGRAWIQITAPISSGSSGGPVLDAHGAVIGITTASVRGGQNLNLVIPVRYVRPLLDSARSRHLESLAFPGGSAAPKRQIAQSATFVGVPLGATEAEIIGRFGSPALIHRSNGNSSVAYLAYPARVFGYLAERRFLLEPDRGFVSGQHILLVGADACAQIFDEVASWFTGQMGTPVRRAVERGVCSHGTATWEATSPRQRVVLMVSPSGDSFRVDIIQMVDF